METAELKEMPQRHPVTISVNDQAVQVEGPKTTGLAIKQAAVTQGVGIGLDFVLSEERPNGKTRIVGDQDPVVVNPQSRFVAVAPDDNS